MMFSSLGLLKKSSRQCFLNIPVLKRETKLQFVCTFQRSLASFNKSCVSWDVLVKANKQIVLPARIFVW